MSVRCTDLIDCAANVHCRARGCEHDSHIEGGLVVFDATPVLVEEGAVSAFTRFDKRHFLDQWVLLSDEPDSMYVRPMLVQATFVAAREYLRLFGSTRQRLGWFGGRWQQCGYQHPLLGDATHRAGPGLVHVPRPLVNLARAVLAGEDQRFGVGTATAGETNAPALPTVGLEVQHGRIIACD